MEMTINRRQAIALVIGSLLTSLGTSGKVASTEGENKVDKPEALLAKAHLRVARPTDDLTAVTKFYRDGLGFEVLYQFQDHDGFDGVMLGHQGATYHLEFTRKKDHKAGHAPTQDNLLVFYLPDRDQWQTAVDLMLSAGYDPVPAFNPYWDTKGKTFEDIDGYRVVLQNAAWK